MKHIPLKDRAFEIINGELFVFEQCLQQSGLSTNYYRKEKCRGNQRLTFIDHPKDRRYNLVSFETLSNDHKQKIKARYGDPYDFVAREPILKLVHKDDKAEQHYINYTFASGNKIPMRRITQYSRAASWLNMLKDVIESGKKIIKELSISAPTFYNHVKAMIDIEKENGASEKYEGTHQLPGDFPSSYGRLLLKVKEYMTAGYDLLIDKMHENKRAAKVKDEVSEAQLITLLEDPRQLDDVIIAMFYNLWAKENNYKPITPPTVGVWRRKKEHLIVMSREGNGAFNEKYIRQVKGLLPSKPLYLVEHDDNNLDFLFSDADYDYHKYISICVVDSRTKLILGKSYTVGQSPQQWQIYHAWLDAMYYIRSITGACIFPSK
jgi:hypothetical protein